MTDITGTDEPTHTDEKALEEPLAVIPIGAGPTGSAAPAVLAGIEPLDDPSLDVEPETDIDDEPGPDPLA
jgi:hypothetical protein